MVRLAQVVLALALLAGTARARCPFDGMPRSACEPVTAYFVPGLVGVGYWPSTAAGLGPWWGGGVEVAPVFWSHNTPKFGPGQGKVVFDIALLGSDDPTAGRLLLYRFGTQLSFERNSSRVFAVPFYGFFIGGLNERTLDHHGFIEATLGLHALHTKNVVITVEGGYLFPFDRVDDLAGWRVSAVANATLW